MSSNSLEKFYQLKEITNKLKEFGYKFNGCISEKKINSFEKKFKVKLPDDYRNYLKIIGNGGAGPSDRCFLYHFHSYFSYIYPLQKTESLLQNHCNYDKRTSFRKLRKKFPYREDNVENQIICNRLSSRKPPKDNIYQGSLILSHQGDNAFLIMEVTGENPGRIWFAEFSRGIGISVVNNSFYDWFNNWVRETLENECIEHGIEYSDFMITDAKAYINLGNSYSDREMLDEAIKRYERAILLDPNNFDPYFYCGRVYLYEDMFEEAIEMYNKYLSINHDNENPYKIAEAYLNLGNSYSKKGMLDETIEQFKKAVYKNPKYEADSYFYLGNAYWNKNMLDQALEQYKKAISINPDDEYYHNRLGDVYLLKDLLDDSIEEYKKAISIAPDEPCYYTKLGDAYSEKGMFEESIEEYKKAISIDPDYEFSYFLLGIIYSKRDMLEESIEMYKKAISLNPNNSEYYYNLGIVYKDKGMLEESREQYKKAISLNSSLDPYDTVEESEAILND